MLEPLVKTIDVPCDQATAFDVFINKMDSWWPLGKFTLSAMKGEPATGIRVDARPDGQIVEIGAGGVETLWGTIKEYDPSDYLSMDFHIPAPGHEEVGERTLVEVRFTSLGDNSTRLELTQSNWQALGDMAEMVHGGYGHGWTMILEGGYLAHFAK